MPNRIIKESICESRELANVSFFAEDLYKRLITYADDYGRFNADAQIILARLYPREIGIVSVDDIEDALTELIGVGKISFYTSLPKKELYGCFPKWKEHQRVRESKKKCPDPTDTKINDWYLRRFIPKDLKKRIIERDGFKCKECGKYVCSTPTSAERLIKMGNGLYHIDHIVPVVQGGRATEENLRLLCPKCNLSRKRQFSFDEILGFAETCGDLPENPADFCLNPIQSNPNPIQSESESPAEPDPKAVLTENAKEVIDYLNEKTGTKYRYSESSLRHIRARLNEKYSVTDCKAVIDKKAAEWMGDAKMQQYLRPETLFGSKFENYLNAPEVKPRGEVLPDWYDTNPVRGDQTPATAEEIEAVKKLLGGKANE